MSEARKVIIDERHLPENEGLLGSRTTSMAADGSIRKDIKIPFCDSCGQMLMDDRPSLCSCRRKICPSCTIIHESRSYCRDCAKLITSVTKQEFFVLYGIANKASVGDIKHTSSMSSESLEESLDSLLSRNLISAKGFSMFEHYSATDMGLEILATCEQIYRSEADVIRFLAKMQEFTEEG
jgi:hypothetical protein